MPSERGSTIAALYVQLLCVCGPVCVCVVCGQNAQHVKSTCDCDCHSNRKQSQKQQQARSLEF